MRYSVKCWCRREEKTPVYAVSNVGLRKKRDIDSGVSNVG